MDDLRIEYGNFRDESNLTRLGEVERVKVCTFWIGKHGPFVERIPVAEFDQAKLAERVEKLRATLRALPT